MRIAWHIEKTAIHDDGGKNMTFYEKIEDLSMALNRKRLVIFVGAGVSKNSGLPTWGQMVQAFAKEIGGLPQKNISGFPNIITVWMKVRAIPPTII